MRSIATEPLLWRVLGETGRLPYFSGAGLGLLKALHETTGPWSAAVCVDERASPVADWLAAQTDTELYFLPKPLPFGGSQAQLRPCCDADAGEIPLLAGHLEREILNVRQIAFGFGTQPARYRERPLDLLLGIRQRVGLIHMGSFRGCASIIEGARRLLHRFGPVVTIVRDTPAGGGEGLADLKAAAAALASFGYALYDSALNACDTEEAILEVLDGWQETVFFAVPRDLDIGAVARRLLAVDGPEYGAGAPGSGRTFAYWSYLASQREDRPAGGDVSLGAEQINDSEGLYPAESWEDLRWRWTGPKPVAAVGIPVVRPGRYKLACRLLKVADDRLFDSLRIFVNGQTLPYQVVRNEHDIVIEAALVLTLTRFKPRTEIRFVHAETYSINPDDPRRLGLALMEILLERQGH
jgi:hypothetical protein